MDTSRESAMMFQLLPEEILILILRKLPECDLLSISLTSTFFYEALQPEIHRNFSIVSQDEKHHDVAVSRFMKSWLTNDNRLQLQGVFEWVRNLKFEAPVHIHHSFDCLRGLELNDATRATRRRIERLEFDDLHRSVENILYCLPPNSLQGFSWHIGCCIPAGIFSSAGPLAQRQRLITSLSVKVSPGYCFTHSLSGLLRLSNLRHFSWREADFIDSYLFYNVIKANSHHLETLDIGFQFQAQLTPHALELSLRSAGLFSSVLDDSTLKFKSLRAITLQNVSFKLAYSVMFPTFDFGKIRFLKLNNCRCVLNVLQALRMSDTPINLETLEFDYEEFVSALNEDESIEEVGGLIMEAVYFIKCFQGLEHLYVRAMDFLVQSTQSTPDAILNHTDTLKRLVYHYHDKLGIGPRQGCDIFWANRLDEVLDKLRLEALGLNIVPCELRPRIDGGETAQTIKLFHFRVTGQYHKPRNLLHKLKLAGLPKECVPFSLRKPCRKRSPSQPVFPGQSSCTRITIEEAQCRMRRLLNMMELLNFVKWAFGPNGLPNLLIIAHGDFSLKERFKWTHLVFCRYPRPDMCIPSAQDDKDGVFGPSLPFRLKHPEDEYLWDEIDGAKELLEACPEDPGPGDSASTYRGEQTNSTTRQSYFSDSDMEGGELEDDSEDEDEYEDFFD